VQARLPLTRPKPRCETRHDAEVQVGRPWAGLPARSVVRRPPRSAVAQPDCVRGVAPRLSPLWLLLPGRTHDFPLGALLGAGYRALSSSIPCMSCVYTEVVRVVLEPAPQPQRRRSFRQVPVDVYTASLVVETGSAAATQGRWAVDIREGGGVCCPQSTAAVVRGDCLAASAAATPATGGHPSRRDRSRADACPCGWSGPSAAGRGTGRRGTMSACALRAPQLGLRT
jgi:hypothetical protein